MPTNPPIGTDYDHIDAMNLGGLTGVVRHMLKDAQAREDVSELKSAFNASTGNGKVSINLDGAIRCGSSPVDFNDIAGSGDYKHTLLNVAPGDKYRITGGSIGVAARLYCFTDDDGVIKASANANATVNNLLIVAPEGSTKLIINNALLAATPVVVTYGDWLVNDVKQAMADVKTIADATIVSKSDKATVELSNNDGYFITTDGTVTAYQTGWWVTDQTDISEFESLIVSARSGYNHLLYAFYDSSNTFISGENSGAEMKTIVDQTVAIPANAKYIRISGVYPDQTPALIGVSNSRLENNANLEKWKGKTWVVIGDSLTEKNNTALIKYYDYVSDDTGIEVNVQAHSGTGYANPGNTDNFLTRAQTVPIDADVYTIFGSFNDYEYSQTHSIQIGTASDTGTNTLCGYINSTISALISRNPLINIGIVSPCPWVSINEYNGAGNGFGKQYSDALKAVAARWSIPYLNLYECSGLRPWNSAFVAAAYTKDSLMGVHPDETGHKILSTKFKEFLEMLLA